MAKRKKVDDVLAALNPSDRVRSLTREVQRLESALSTSQAEHGQLQVLFDQLAGLVESLPPQPVRKLRPRARNVTSPIAVVWHATDWHMGATQEPDEVEGFGENSPELLRRRLGNMVADLLDWVEVHRRSYQVDECRVLCTGDLISGDIHDELKITNAWPAPRQTIEAANLLAASLMELAPHFPRIIVDFVTVDNHARLTRKPQHKEAGFNSFNYPLGRHAQALVAGQPNIEFKMHPKEQQVVEVKGRRYLLCHGHQVMGWAGFPYYGIQRKAGKEAMKRMRRRKEAFDLIVLGHWHAPLKHPWYWIGASASGTDAYDHSQGREAEPMQSTWMVHPKHGEFDATDWRLRV
jgi:hypothetical protein